MLTALTTATAEMTITDQIAQLAAQGEQLLIARRRQEEEAEAQRRAERARELAEKWQPRLELARRILPAWMHEHLSTPPFEPEKYCGGAFDIGEWRYEPMTLALPDCAPIYLFIFDAKTGPIYYVPARYELKYDEGLGDEGWFVWPAGSNWRTEYDLADATDDLAIAIHLARQEHQRLPELTAEIERRNAERDLDQMPDAQPTSKSRLEQAEAAVEAGDYQQAIALALLALVERQGD